MSVEVSPRRAGSVLGAGPGRKMVVVVIVGIPFTSPDYERRVGSVSRAPRTSLFAVWRILRFQLSGHSSLFLRKSGTPYGRSEEHTSELQSLMRISYAVFCLKKKTTIKESIYTNMICIIHQ